MVSNKKKLKSISRISNRRKPAETVTDNISDEGLLSAYESSAPLETSLPTQEPQNPSLQSVLKANRVLAPLFLAVWLRADYPFIHRKELSGWMKFFRLFTKNGVGSMPILTFVSKQIT